MLDKKRGNRNMKIEAVIIENDYKGSFRRYALTLTEFEKEFAAQLAVDMPMPSEEAQSYTLRPMVHLWYKKTLAGPDNKEWVRFFRDLTDGLSESDISNGNAAYIAEEQMKSLIKYLPKKAAGSANNFPNAERVMDIRKQYPPGTRIILTEDLDDPQPIRAGEKGTVIAVDDAGQIRMNWDCGSTLALIVDVDNFKPDYLT